MRTARYPQHMTVRSRIRVPVIVAATVTALTAALLPPVAAAEEYPPADPVGKIAYPELASIMTEAGHALRYSMAVVAADPGREYEQGTVEADLRQGVLSLSEEYRERVVTSAKQMLEDPKARQENFGQYAEIDPEKYASLGFGNVFTSEYVKFDAKALADRLRARAEEMKAEHDAEEQRAVDYAKQIGIKLPFPQLSSLDLRIDQVLCVDETGPDFWEWVNADRIDVGGVSLDHRGRTRPVSSQMVGHFNDGTVKSYPAPGLLHSHHDLTTSGEWPRTYYGVIMLAEIDDGGGFAQAIRDVWLTIRDKVVEVIIEWIVDLLEGWLGTSFAEAIGEAIAWLIGGFFEWLASLFSDDVFAPKTVRVDLPSPYEFMYTSASHYGWTNYRLPTRSLTYTGFGGQYRLNYHWQVNP